MERSVLGDEFFYNYRGVGNCDGVYGHSYSPDDLFNDGYAIAKYVIDNDLSKGKKLILNGRSLGGAVATNVARRLREEGIEVELIVDRSFSSVSAYVAETMHLGLKSIKDDYIKQNNLTEENKGQLLCLISYPESIINFYVTTYLLGLSLGNLVSGVISTLGVILTYPIAFFGYMLAEGILLMGLPLELAKVVNQIFSTLAEYIHGLIDFLGSVIGAMLGSPGIIIASLVMHLLIPVMIVRSFFTDTPFIHMPTVFSLALNSINFNMNSVSEIERIVALGGKEDTITIINTENDNVIPVDASLSCGLGNKPREARLNTNVNSMWYSRGGHNEPLDENNLISTIN